MYRIASVRATHEPDLTKSLVAMIRGTIRASQGTLLRLVAPSAEPSTRWPTLPPTACTGAATMMSAAARDVLSTRKEAQVIDSHMSYLDTGPVDGGNKTVIFLHGNPTSAFLWRGVIPHVQGIARCLAPDLIGMGRSGKLPGSSYGFADHFKYFAAWMDTMELPEKVSIVGHDWGSALGFHWSRLHRERLEALVFMEGFPEVFPDWNCLPETAQKLFKSLREQNGEHLILEHNFFVERMLPYQVMHSLTDEEMAEYRRPYLKEGESRRPTLSWLRQIPFGDDGPGDVIDIINSYSKWLRSSRDLPKLYIDAHPGFFSPTIRNMVNSWPNLKVAYVKGFHYMQEDSAEDIGKAVADFLGDVHAKQR